MGCTRLGDGHGGRLPWAAAAAAGETFERPPRLATRGNKEAKNVWSLLLLLSIQPVISFQKNGANYNFDSNISYPTRTRQLCAIARTKAPDRVQTIRPTVAPASCTPSFRDTFRFFVMSASIRLAESFTELGFVLFYNNSRRI